MIVRITSEPAEEQETDGSRYYCARGRIEPHGKAVDVLIPPADDGGYCPVELDDRCVCIGAAGVAYVTRVLLPLVGDQGGAERVVYPPRSGTRTRIGARTGGAWEPVALHSRGSAETRAAWDAIDAIVTVVAGLPGGSSITGTVNGIKTALGGPITGGTASAGFESRGAS